MNRPPWNAAGTCQHVTCLECAYDMDTDEAPNRKLCVHCVDFELASTRQPIAELLCAPCDSDIVFPQRWCQFMPAGHLCKQWLLATLVMSTATAVSSAGELAVIEQQQADSHWAVFVGCASLCCMFVWHVYRCVSGLANLRTRVEAVPPPCPQVFYVTPTGHKLHQDRKCHTIKLNRSVRPYELCRVCCAELVEEKEVGCDGNDGDGRER